MTDRKEIVYPSDRPVSNTSGAIATGNKRIVYPHPTGNSSYPSWRSTSKSSSYRPDSADDFSFETKLNGRFVLKVYKASVTRVNVDVIVNAANDIMVHAGGVAKVISDAAGYALDDESKYFVDTHGPLRVGKNVVTTAGKLPYAAVIHAVGPMWSAYRDKVACLDDLYDCIYNILDRCKKRRYATVAMAAISAGIFGVPKKLCADMYVYAAANFSYSLRPQECPRELHIIDVDTSILRLVEESVQRWRKDPESLNQRFTLPKFLKENPHLVSYSHSSDEDQKPHPAESQNFRRGRNDVSFELTTRVEKIKDQRFSWGGVAKQFMVDNQIKVKIYQGNICKVKNMDVIVCGISKSLEPQGFVADALKHAGGDLYIRSHKRMVAEHKKEHVKYSDVFICDGGNLGAKYALHAVIRRVMEADTKEMEEYQDCMTSVLRDIQRNGWKRIAMPMIGTGTIQTSKRKLKLCGTAFLKALDEFVFQHADNHEIKEIHLVNNKYEVDKALVEVFDEETDQKVAGGGSTDIVPDRSNGHAGAAQGASYRNSHSSRSRWSHSNGKPTDRTKRDNDGSYYESRTGQSKERARMSDEFEDESAGENGVSFADKSDEGAAKQRSDREIPDGNLLIIE